MLIVRITRSRCNLLKGGAPPPSPSYYAILFIYLVLSVSLILLRDLSWEIKKQSNEQFSPPFQIPFTRAALYYFPWDGVRRMWFNVSNILT